MFGLPGGHFYIDYSLTFIHNAIHAKWKAERLQQHPNAASWPGISIAVSARATPCGGRTPPGTGDDRWICVESAQH